ncbi:MAG TPA: hypothetical protein VFC18_21680 [Burkholderiales bacterium]|nr:hypothetical protein [Burkholderiales bacterium]
MKTKQLVMRLPAHVKPEAVLIMAQTSVGHMAAAMSHGRRNASRNGFDAETITDPDLRSAIQYLQLATTQAINDLTAPRAISSSSTAVCEVTSSDEVE